MSDNDILVVGSIALDSVRTPFGEAESVLGGSAAYFSFAARHFSRVRLVAVVGEDFPTPHRELLESCGVDLSGLEVAPGRTFRWRGEYTMELGHAHTLATELNVFSKFHPKLDAQHRRCPYVFLANIDPDLQLEVLDQMENPRLVVSDTMNYWIARKPDRVLEVLRRVDTAFLNEEEARSLAGETQLARAGRRLLQQGARSVLIKKGEHGALYQSPQGRFVTPSYPLESLTDPTGAGDSFAGGFVGYLSRSGRQDPPALRHAMLFGTALASIAIEAFSAARLVESSPAEIEDRVGELHRMIHFELSSLWER